MFDECAIELNLGMDVNIYICVAFCHVLQKHNYHSFSYDWAAKVTCEIQHYTFHSGVIPKADVMNFQNKYEFFFRYVSK